MKGGVAHQQFRSKNVSLITADDNFAGFVMETAKSLVKFNKRIEEPKANILSKKIYASYSRFGVTF